MYRLDHLRNRFIKNAIRSNVLINRLNFCYLSVSKFYLAVRTILKTVLTLWKTVLTLWPVRLIFFLNRSNDLGNRLNAYDSRLLSVYYPFFLPFNGYPLVYVFPNQVTIMGLGCLSLNTFFKLQRVSTDELSILKTII